MNYSKIASFVIILTMILTDIHYIQKSRICIMKSTQLLSVVFSLIMFTGVTAGSTAFADSDDLEDMMEDFCEMSLEEQSDFFADYPDMVEYNGKLSIICEIADEDELEDEANEDDTKEDDRDETDDRDDKYDRYADLDDRLEHFCDMITDEKRQFFEDHPRLEQFSGRLANYCDLSEDEREDAIDKFIAEHKDVIRDYMNEKIHDKVTDKIHDKMTDIHMNYDRLCSMTESNRASEITDVAKLDRISKWCNMTPEKRKDYKKEHHDDIKDKVSDRIRMSDMSSRLKAMIMDKHGISDEKHEEIKMKY